MSPNYIKFHKCHINTSNIIGAISHLSLVVVSVTSFIAPAARLPGALLTRRKLGHEQLHLSLSSLQTDDPLSVGLRLLPHGLRLLPHGLNLLLKLSGVGVPPSGRGDSKNIQVQLEPHDTSKCLEGRSCTDGAPVAASA